MRTYIIAFLMLISTVSFADSTTVKADTTKITVREVYTDAKEAIKQLGAALKVGAEHVYTVLVKQQIVHSITNCLIYIFLFISIRYAIIRFYRYAKEQDDYPIWEPQVVFGTMGLVIIVFFAGMFFLKTIEITVTGFVNPEYGALKDIVDMINKH